MTHERVTWEVDPIEGVGPDSRPMIDHGSKSDRMTRGDSVHYLKQPPKEIFIIFSIKYIIRQHENENKFLKKVNLILISSPGGGIPSMHINAPPSLYLLLTDALLGDEERELGERVTQFGICSGEGGRNSLSRLAGSRLARISKSSASRELQIRWE